MKPQNCIGCDAPPRTPHHHQCHRIFCHETGLFTSACGHEWAHVARVLASSGYDAEATQIEVYFDVNREHDCGSDLWSGICPKDIACFAFDLWAVGPPWRRVPAGTPGAVLDLNTLATDYVWVKSEKKFRKRSPKVVPA